MRPSIVCCVLAIGLSCLELSCTESAPQAKKASYPVYEYAPTDFKDDVTTNSNITSADLELVFQDSNGAPVDLKQYRGNKNVVLVVMRGYPGYICTNCSAQTSRLITNYPEFARRNAEVLVVFPGPTDHLPDFFQAIQGQAHQDHVPFPILLDGNFSAITKLGIRGDLAKPSTYIIDKRGQVRFAYVGANSADRPSLKAMLRKLDEIAQG